MSSKSILTNFFPIDLYHPEYIELKIFPYSRDKLRKLRKEYNETHSFFRVGDKIIGSWMEGEQIEGEEVQVVPNESQETTSSLIKHIFFRAFIQNTEDIVPLNFHPFSFISSKDSHDAVRSHLPEKLKDFISFDRQYEIALRTITSCKGELKYGFTININHRWDIKENIGRLSKRGFKLKGLNAIHSEPIPGKKGILAPSESFLGPIAEISGDTAKIDSNYGKVELPTDELYLRRNTSEIKELLSQVLNKQQADKIVSKARKSSYIKSDYKDYYSKIRNLVSNGFCKWRYYSKDEFEFIFSKNSELIHNDYSLESNKFIFDYGTGSASSSIIKGLKEFGPFDSNSFTPKSPKILVVCHSQSRGGFSSAMGSLRDGITSSSYYRRGMKDLFRLQELNFDFAEIADSTPYAYLHAIRQKLAQNDYDLVVLEGTDKDEYTTPKENPYYQVKGFLLSQGIPVQALQARNTRNKRSLQYILAPLALQIYSKMGGVPWVLPSSNDVDWEIVVGVSHTYIRDNQYSGNQNSRIVGLTTFFSSDGNLLFSDNSKATDYDNFFEELLLSLKRSVNRLSQEMAWKEGQTVRFIFHVFKPMKNTELRVVQELVNEFEDFEIKFAFVQVIKNHPFLLFDKKSKGARKNKGSRVNRKFVPLRGTNLILNESECLLTTLGADELNIPGQAPSSPVLIRLHQESTFKDMHHIVQQVFKFSHHSWRSINPTHMPVTLYYANMIARLLGKLRDVPEYTPESLLNVMRRKKWFL